MRAIRKLGVPSGWPAGVVLLSVALLVFRFCLGYLFGGTNDQAAHVYLWALVEQHRNLYADSSILVWPPYWWIVLGLWASLWKLLGAVAPALVLPLGRSFCLKLLYYAFELCLAFVIAAFVGRARGEDRRQPAAPGTFLGYAGAFLLLPATWVITSLHGNFDVMPTLFVVLAYFLLEYENTETSALLAALLVGLAIMARTFPAAYAFPALALIARRFRWRTGVLAGTLMLAPSFLSLCPVYLMTPRAVVSALSYRGTQGGWWGLPGLARLTVSDALSAEVLSISYPVFYALLLLLLGGLSWGLWSGRIGILQAGIVASAGLFCLAPTIGNQNLYFIVPWAFWCAVVERQRAARLLLWFLSVDLFLIYIVVPLDLTHPIWFQWTYDFAAAGHVPPLASPRWLVAALGWLASAFKRNGLDYDPFVQLSLRLPVWGVLAWWFVMSVKKALGQLTHPTSQTRRPN